MRKTLKFLHTMASIGFAGGLAALIVLHGALPEPVELERFATLRTAMSAISKWIVTPSTLLVLVSGLLSMAVVPAYQSAGWVWAKLLSGIIVFEGTLIYVLGPMERAGRQARAALAGEFDVALLGATLEPELTSFWVILAVAVANVVLGVWRPRFSKPRPSVTPAG